MSRLKLFSKADKKAMKKLHDETTPTILPPKKDCPNCGAGWFNCKHCYDCGYIISSPPLNKT